MDSYQRFARAPEFRPRSVGSSSDLARQRAQQQEADLRRFAGQLEQRSQNLIEDTRFVGQDLEALSKFSKTALDLVESNIKQTIKDKDIGAQFDALYNPDVVVPEEYEALAESVTQQASAGQAANQVEASGDILTAEKIRNDLNQIGQGVADEKALLLNARSRYAGDITALVNSEYADGKLQQLYTTDPSAALAIATKIWIQKNNLQNTTKANFVDVLGETIRSTMSYMATNQSTERIKLQKQERLAEIKSTAFQSGRTATEENVGQTFQYLAEQLYLDNNGITLKSTANRVAAEQLLAGAVLQSPDQVTLIGRALVIPGQKGTSIADTYPELVFEANKQAEKTKEQTTLRIRKEKQDELNKELSNPALTIEERLAIQEQKIQELEALGDYTGAQEIRANTLNNAVSPENQLNYLQLEQRITQGEGVSDQEIIALQNSGDITRAQGSAARTLRDTVFKTKLGAATTTATAGATLFTGKLKINSNLQFDPTVGFTIIGNKNSPLTPGQASYLQKEYKAALAEHLKKTALDIGPDKTDAEARQILQQASNEFYETQTQNPNGNFYVGGLFTYDTAVQDGTTEFIKIKDAARFLGLPPNPTTLPSGSKDWSSTYNPNLGVTPQMKRDYKIFDRIFTSQEFAQYQAEVQSGIFDSKLVRTARDLNVTLNQLLYSEGKYNQGNYTRPTEDVFFKNQILYRTDDPRMLTENAVQGFNALLNEGYSVQGAAMIAAYAYYHSKQQDRNYFQNNVNNLTFVKGSTQPFEKAGLIPLFRNSRASYRTLQSQIPNNVQNFAIQILRAAGVQ